MRKRALIQANTAVLLFGLAGLFARWIRLPAICITFGRVFFSSITLGIWLRVREKGIPRPERRDILAMVGAGAVLALHWWSFLQSIQLSTVAIGTITFSSFPLFLTFLEPLFFHERLTLRNVLTALVILAGVIITVPEFSLENSMVLGIAVGMVSALTYAVLTLLNRYFAGKYSGTVISFYEQASAAVILLPFVLKAGVKPTPTDLGLLLFLGVVTTAAAHTLFISSLKDIPARLAGVISSLETVYGILFAWLLLGEVPRLREIIGGTVIIAAVAMENIKSEISG